MRSSVQPFSRVSSSSLLASQPSLQSAHGAASTCMSLCTCMLRKRVFKPLSRRCTQTHTHRHACTQTPSWVSLIFTSRPHASCAATGPKLTLRFLRLLVYMCVCTYHVCNNYVTYIVAMRPCFSGLRQFRRLLCVAIMSSLAQL